MSKKKTILLCAGLFFAAIGVSAIMIFLDVRPEEKKDMLQPIRKEQANEIVDSALSDIQTGLDADELELDYATRIFLSNPNDLYESGIPEKGYGLFEGYMNQYIDYYFPGEEHYQVNYIVGSAVPDQVATIFKVEIPELELEVKCLYKHAERTYKFESPLDDLEQ